MQIKGIIFKVANFALVISFFLVCNSFKANPHPYFISVTELRLNSGQKTISLSCKMFTDDLQMALSKLHKGQVDLMNKNLKPDSLVSTYVKHRLEVFVGDKKIDFKYLGYEIEEEATWCYFESTLPSEEKSVNVRSSILYDFIESQVNFIHCYYNNDRKSYKLDKPDQSAVFVF
jgi:hypothetical protein